MRCISVSGGTTDVFEIGLHTVALEARGDVLTATPYSLFLAASMPEMVGKIAVDVGTGSGALGIVARLQGAALVYVLDVNPIAIECAPANAARNHVADGFEALPTGSTMLPLPDGATVDYIICNPAQLPMHEPANPNDPFFAGPDGRGMIEGLVREAPTWLAQDGCLLITHNSLCDLPSTRHLMDEVGLESRLLAEQSIEFPPFIDREWIDQLGGTARELYSIIDRRPHETLYVLEATRRP